MKESLSNERDLFWKEIGIIQNTEGFPYLTKNQQRMIILSLYLQDRSERKNDPDSISELYIDRSYCHDSIYILETNQVRWPKSSEDLPPNFFNAKYLPVTNKTEAVQLIEHFVFPCVVHINRPLLSAGKARPFHSFLALGHDTYGEIVLWEKEGFGYPFRITNIEAQLERYGTIMSWGVRRLRNKS